MAGENLMADGLAGVPIDWAVVMRDDYPRAVAAMGRFMPLALRSAYDPEDFVSRAIADLVADPRPFAGFSTLVLFARRRMIEAFRIKRLARGSVGVSSAIAGRASPADEMDAGELRSRVLARCGDAFERRLVELRLGGYTTPEICAVSGVAPRTLQRLFAVKFAGLR